MTPSLLRSLAYAALALVLLSASSAQAAPQESAEAALTRLRRELAQDEALLRQAQAQPAGPDKAEMLQLANDAIADRQKAIADAERRAELERRRRACPKDIDPVVWEQFQKKLFEERAASDRRLESMISTFHKFKMPPLPGKPMREVDEGIILGMLTTEKEALEILKNQECPFTGEKFSKLPPGKALAFAFGTDDALLEGMRAFGDHLTLGQYTLNLPYVKNLMPSLQDTHYKRLLAHSNGATVTEALIRADVIKVDHLEIAGGDRSLISRESLQQLLDSGKVKTITVWINPGDPVPLLTGNPKSAQLEGIRSAAYRTIDLLRGTEYVEGAAHVEYRVLNQPSCPGQDFGIEAHRYDSYSCIISKARKPQ